MSYINLVESVVKGVVDYPDQVDISEDLEGNTRTFFVRVHGDDVGKIIGKSGRVVSAIRCVISAVAARAHERAFVKIVTE